MKKIIKLKLPLIILSQGSLIWLIYLVHFSNNKNNTIVNLIAVVGTIIGSIAVFLEGLEYISIKKSKKRGYITCIVSIIMPFPIILFLAKVMI